jgi:hypothetical protein
MSRDTSRLNLAKRKKPGQKLKKSVAELEPL